MNNPMPSFLWRRGADHEQLAVLSRRAAVAVGYVSHTSELLYEYIASSLITDRV